MKHGRPGQRRPTLELTRRRKLAVYAILVATWLTGALWLLLHYFFARTGELGNEPNPLEFWVLASHGASAFAFLWLAGWMWNAHITPWWRGGRRRSSGVVLISFAGILIGSGYLLYYASGDALREWTGLVHWIVGLVAAFPMIVHALRSALYRRRG